MVGRWPDSGMVELRPHGGMVGHHRREMRRLGEANCLDRPRVPVQGEAVGQEDFAGFSARLASLHVRECRPGPDNEVSPSWEVVTVL
jgi:hypothetical protein